METRRIRDLEALSLLCKELARLGLAFGITDARPAVWVRTGLTGSKVWITVNPSGQLFTWRRDGHLRVVGHGVSAFGWRLVEAVDTEDAGGGAGRHMATAFASSRADRGLAEAREGNSSG